MSNDMQSRVNDYNALVREYEALDAQIRDLLTAYGGRYDNLSAEGVKQYRELANRRDELFSEVRSMEQELFSDE